MYKLAFERCLSGDMILFVLAILVKDCHGRSYLTLLLVVGKAYALLKRLKLTAAGLELIMRHLFLIGELLHRQEHDPHR
jgi:hypothetical protein